MNHLPETGIAARRYELSKIIVDALRANRVEPLKTYVAPEGKEHGFVEAWPANTEKAPCKAFVLCLAKQSRTDYAITDDIDGDLSWHIDSMTWPTPGR